MKGRPDSAAPTARRRPVRQRVTVQLLPRLCPAAPSREHAPPSLLPADLHLAPVSQGTTLGCSLAPTTPLTTTHLSRASPSQPGLLQGQPLLAVPLPRKRRDATPFARLFPNGGAHQSSTRRPCENADCRPHLQIGGEAHQSAFPDMFPG